MNSVICGTFALCASCAAPVPSNAAPTQQARSSSATLPSASSSATVSPVTPAPPSLAVAPAALELHAQVVLNEPIRAIGLGEGGRLGAIASEPYVRDARGLHALPLPAALRTKAGETDQVRIFFGRDNEPRIMGTRHSLAGEASIYWRHTNNGWKDGREEIGHPELVCRAGSICIIKRTSGWITAPAGPAPRHVELLNGTLWGLDESGLANIDAHGWALLMPAPKWSEPRAFWAASGEAWVVADRALFHFHEGTWSGEPSPIAEPAALWAARADSVWLVGKGGAAHFDGRAWRTLAVAGPLAVVTGRSDSELWFGGDAGLLRVQP
jgi:hypothetical protein